MSDIVAKGDESKNVSSTGLDGPEAEPREGTIISLDPELERRTLRKFDKWLLPPLLVILLLAYLDRSNLGRFIRTAKLSNPDTRVLTS